MKLTRLKWYALVFLLGCLGTYFGSRHLAKFHSNVDLKKNNPKNFSKKDNNIKTAKILDKATLPKEVISNPSTPNLNDDLLSSIDSYIRRISFLDQNSLLPLLSELDSWSSEARFDLIYGIYLDASQTDLEMRRKALWLAKRFNHNSFYPLWEDVIERHTKGTIYEEEDPNLENLDNHSPTFKREAELEQLIALEALGEIRSNSEKANKLLERIVLGKHENFMHRIFLRESAFDAIKGSHSQPFTWFIQNSLPDDPLRKRLSYRLRLK